MFVRRSEMLQGVRIRASLNAIQMYGVGRCKKKEGESENSRAKWVYIPGYHRRDRDEGWHSPSFE